MNKVVAKDFNELFDWYKENKPELIKETYAGLNIGDIVKTLDEEYYVIYPSESYLADSGIHIPLRKINNDKNTITRIEGGKAGIQVFKCNEPIKIIGKTDFLCFEHFCWEGDENK